MAKCGYSIVTPATVVALAAGVAKSILGVKGNAAFGVDLKKMRVAFDGVTAANVPVLVELCYATFATNSPGTASTSITPVQTYGRVSTHGFTAAGNWTTEPTVLSPIESWLVTPNGGFMPYDFPLGDTPDSALAEGFVIRCNAPAIVNVRGTMIFERA